MINIIKNYLKELGIEYIPGMKVRWRTRHGNSSSDHVCILSQRKLPDKLDIHDYPQLECRVINNVLYINNANEDDYDSKRGFYFSSDHYTIIEKINYALSLLIYDVNPYSNSIYLARIFKFHNKRELEESKRLLIKYYVESVKPLRLLLLRYFHLDDVVFTFDRVVDTFLSINSTDPDVIFTTLVNAGLIDPEDNEGYYENMVKERRVDTDEFIVVDSVSASNSDYMEKNVLENDETLADFILGQYSEIYPVSEGSYDEVYSSLVKHGIVLDKVADEDVTLTCDMLIKDYDGKSSPSDAKLIRAQLSSEVSLFSDVAENSFNMTRSVDSESIRTTDKDTGLVLFDYQLDVEGWVNSPVTVFDYALNCPVIETRYSNISSKDRSYHFGIKFDGSKVYFSCSVKTSSINSFDGKYILVNRIAAVSDDEQKRKDLLKSIILSLKDEDRAYSIRNINLEDIDSGKLDDPEISAGIQTALDNYLTDLGTVFGGRFPELAKLADVTNPKYFEKVEVMGISYYWFKFSELLPLMNKYKNSLENNERNFICTILDCCQKVMGNDWIDRLIYTNPVYINYCTICE